MKVAKIDCTQHEEVLDDLEIRGFPTIVLFKRQKIVNEYSGGQRNFNKLLK